MKKAFIILAMLLSVSAMAQNRGVILQESFDSNSMPAGWQITEGGFSNWSISPTTYAGGTPKELHLSWSPYFNTPTRMVFNAVDLTGIYTVTFSFNHYVTHVTQPCTISIETSSNGGNTWNRCFSRSVDYDQIMLYEESLDITNADMGQANVLFSIYIEPYVSSTYFDDWYFDNILIMGEQGSDVLDLGISTINVADEIGSGDRTIGMLVRNFGTIDITSVEASYQVSDNQSVSETFSVNIPPMEATNLTFAEPANFALGDYTLSMEIINVNGTADDDQSDDQMSKNITANLGYTQKIPLLEVFSSSGCEPCVALNAQMQTLCDNNPGKYSYIKYCMNAPYDPYYTFDVTQRGNHLPPHREVPFAPFVYMDCECLMNYAPSQELFDGHCDMLSPVEIRGSFYTEGSMVYISADVLSYMDMTDASIWVSVNEKVTTGNVGSNGETEFHHVMMKLLPDGNGKPFSIRQGEVKHFDYNYDMSTTFVEEMDDLEVVVWVEEPGIENTLNSRFMYETTEHPYPVENLILAKEGTTFTASWNAAENAQPTGYNVTLNGALVVENGSATEYTFYEEEGKFYIVEVQAVYGDEMVSVKRVITSYEILAVAENETNDFKVFPNPTHDRVTIQATATIQNAAIYDMMGRLISTVKVNDKAFEMNLVDYDNGVYFIKLQMADGKSEVCRVAVSR